MQSVRAQRRIEESSLCFPGSRLGKTYPQSQTTLKTCDRPNLFPARKTLALANLLQRLWDGRAAHAYPELEPRPSIRGCGTNWYPPIASRRQAKKREQSGSWIAEPALRAWENQPLPGPPPLCTQVPGNWMWRKSTGPGFEVSDYKQDSEQ